LTTFITHNNIQIIPLMLLCSALATTGAVIYYTVDRYFLIKKFDQAKKEWCGPLEDWENIIRQEYIPEVNLLLENARHPHFEYHLNAQLALHRYFTEFDLNFKEHQSIIYNNNEPARIKFNLLLINLCARKNVRG